MDISRPMTFHPSAPPVTLHQSESESGASAGQQNGFTTHPSWSSLPPEIWCEVTKYLSVREAVELSHTCKKLFEIIPVNQKRITILVDHYYGYVKNRHSLLSGSPGNEPAHLIRDDFRQWQNNHLTHNDIKWLKDNILREHALFCYLTGLQQEAIKVCSLETKSADIAQSLVKHMALLSRGRMAICQSNKLEILDLTNPSEPQHITTLGEHGRSVPCFAVLPDELLATGSNDSTVKIWNPTCLSNPACIATLTGHNTIVSGIVALPGKRLATSSFDNTLKIWDLTRPPESACIATLEGHSKQVTGLVGLPNGLLVSKSFDKTLRLWNIHQNPPLKNTILREGENSNICSLAALSDTCLVTGSDDNILQVWRIINHSELVCIARTKLDGPIKNFCPLPYKQLVINCSNCELDSLGPDHRRQSHINVHPASESGARKITCRLSRRPRDCLLKSQINILEPGHFP